MIRQMGISLGIMNYYTFGILNHPTASPTPPVFRLVLLHTELSYKDIFPPLFYSFLKGILPIVQSIQEVNAFR